MQRERKSGYGTTITKEALIEQKGRKLGWFRIALDVVMLLLTATMFSRHAISQLYHEIAGFALIALFIVHFVINVKMLAALAKNRAGKARPIVILVLDMLTCVVWIAVLVTSVLVSKEIFPFGMRQLHPWHKFASAIAFLLTGVHFGLHWSYFWKKIYTAIKKPKAVAAILLAVVLAFGCYSLCTSGYSGWISAPFSSRQGHGGNGQMRSGEEGESAPWGNGENAPWGNRDGNNESAPWGNRGDNENAPNNKDAETLQDQPSGEQSFDLDRMLDSFATGLFVLLFFGAVTHVVDLLLSRKKKTVSGGETPADVEVSE